MRAARGAPACRAGRAAASIATSAPGATAAPQQGNTRGIAMPASAPCRQVGIDDAAAAQHQSVTHHASRSSTIRHTTDRAAAG